MEEIQENRLLNLTPNIFENIRKIYNLDKPGRLEDAVNILQEWIQKQDHIIKKDFTKGYLERTLGTCKGSVEKAKMQIDRLCTMKTLLPKFFSKTNIKMELQSILNIMLILPLPIMTEDYYRIIIIKFSSKDFSTESFMQYFQYGIIVGEYLKRNDYFTGIIVIYDCRDLNLFDVILKMNTVELQQFVTILIEGYGARIKGIYFIAESKAIELLVNTIKQLVSEKIGNRLHVKRSLEDLHKVVPKELLPVDYGGKQESIDILQAQWVEELSLEKNVEYIKMMFKACTDETKRHAGKFNEEYMGMPGSFRNLSVD